MIQTLSPDQLTRAFDLQALNFETTDELDSLDYLLGQSRAMEAIHFAVSMPHDGYNLYVMGDNGIGKHSAVKQILAKEALNASARVDWLYVYNFDAPDNPRFLKVTAGVGRLLKKQLEHFVYDLIMAVIAGLNDPAFEGLEEQALDEAQHKKCVEIIHQLMQPLQDQFANEMGVSLHLSAIKKDLLDNVDDLRVPSAQQEEVLRANQKQIVEGFPQYLVNLFCEAEYANQKPVIYESNPTYQNLIGRIEHVATMGALITDFSMIKPGALHRANGGYLVLDANRLLRDEFAWDALKRMLRAKEIRIESIEQVMSLVTTSTLEPEAIPLDVKIILLGDREWYYELLEYDPEFATLFKVQADFEEAVTADTEQLHAYVSMVKGLIEHHDLLPMSRAAVEALMSESARWMEDVTKLSLNQGDLSDALREANFFAVQAGRTQMEPSDIDAMLQARERRSNRLPNYLYEAIERQIVRVQTEGHEVGRINGLSVMDLGAFSLGQPSVISATVSAGDDGIVDIERESELAGDIHSKAVMILTAFLSSRFGQTHPFEISASLAFEQNYGEVDGDSASCAEVCALISAMIHQPINQQWAMTGSMNQMGDVQAIGGVNEKIEGFFEVCQRQGLTGEQGVIIPRSNVQHLLLKAPVREAVEQGQFKIVSIDHVSEALELSLGLSMQEIDRLVHQRLDRMHKRKKTSKIKEKLADD